MTLAPLDWIIIAVYIGVCLAAGMWMRRYVFNVEEFAIAGRAVRVNLGTTSLAATELGLVTVMYTAQLGYEKGFAGATIGVLMALAIFLVGSTGFVIEPLRNAGVVTIPELFEKRFSPRVRWVAGLFVALGGLLNMGIFLRLGGDFLVFAVGLPPHWLEWVMTALLILVFVYTAFGGMLSVLVTDYIQFLIVGIGVVITSLLILWNLGWSNIVDGLWSSWVNNVADPTRAASHPFNPFDASSFGWGYLLWNFMLQIAIATTWQTQISRVLSAEDSRTGRRIYTRVAFYYVGRFALPGLWGAAAYVYFNQHGGLPAGIDSMTAMPTYLGTLLPVGLLGLVIAAMIAAEMSTVSGYMLTWETVIFNDLIMPCLKRPLSPAKQLVLTRFILFAIAIFLLLYGLWYKMPGNAYDYLAITANIYLASVFSLLVGGLYWPGANTTGAYAALVLGAVGPIAFLVVNSIVDKSHQIPPAIAGASSFVLAFAGLVVGSLLETWRTKR